MNIETSPTRRPTPLPRNLNENRFVTRLLPWILGGGFLLLYSVTLSRWVTINSLLPVATLSGYTSQPDLTKPLFWLLTLPFRLLPSAAVPVAANLFSALCAALTLATLARSVAILPHDRTEEQRIREKNTDALLTIPIAWLPPVFAAIACGLQLTFWEHATAFSAEMLDLLLFAYVIRCVLEFRLDARQSWLSRASFIYAVGMANNWAMVAFFPAFLGALLWIKGLSFFNLRFLMRMFVLGVAGLSLYLLLPIYTAFSSDYVSFFQALRENLGQQNFLVKRLFNRQLILNPDRPQWILLLPSLLPLLVIGVRWPAYFGDPSKLGMAISTFTFHLFHALLLAFCVWIALDAPMSPRNHSFFPPALSLYYLGALGIGYLLGYFLLIFGTKPFSRRRPLDPLIARVYKLVLAGTWALVIVTPILLLYKNIPLLRQTNTPILHQYASLLKSGFTPGSVALSDDSNNLFLLQTASNAGRHPDSIFLITGGNSQVQTLQLPIYHAWLKHTYGDRWPLDPPEDSRRLFSPLDLARLMLNLAQSNTVSYLHPSFGYYFEVLYPEPNGILNTLKPYPTNSIFAPPLSQPILDANLRFWSEAADSVLPPVIAGISAPASFGKIPFLDRALSALHIPKSPNPTAQHLALFYSRSLTAWGVQLQRAGQLTEAAKTFKLALKLRPENPVAKWNLECNQQLQNNEPFKIELTKAIQEQVERFGNLENILNASGPLDHPTLCFEQARFFGQQGHYRQAAQLFQRVKQLCPDHLPTRLLLSSVYLTSEMPDFALTEIKDIPINPARFGLDSTNAPDLLKVQMAAFLMKRDLPAAESALHSAIQRFAGDDQAESRLLAAASASLIAFGFHSNAIPVLDQHLRLISKLPAPDHPQLREAALLNDKGFVLTQVNRFDDAIAALSRSLKLQTNTNSELYYITLFNRALASMKNNRLDEASSDYNTLYAKFPSHPAVNFGLGEIAFAKQNFPVAINHYTTYLQNAPTNTTEATNVLSHLAEAERQSP